MTDTNEENSCKENNPMFFSMEKTHTVSDRLYGRRRSHPLRERQKRLIKDYLPRIRFPKAAIQDPHRAFKKMPEAIWLEIGFGGGEHSLNQHHMHPEIGYIACEVFENGICSLLSTLINEQDEQNQETEALIPDMLRIWDEDARVLIRTLPPQSIDRVFLLFPDPWPKARHAKRRFIHPERLPLIHRILSRQGLWHIASDDPTYQTWVEEILNEQQQPYFKKIFQSDKRPDDWPSTRYEQKAYKAGRKPIFWIFEKI